MPNLYKFQKVGVQWLIDHDGIGLVADEVGLGKTCQALTYCKVNPELRPVLIVCPASIKINWQREITMWTGETSFIISGKKAEPIPKANFYIINYDILATELKLHTGKLNKNGKPVFNKVLSDTSWIYRLGTMGLKVLISDEAQNLSNDTAIKVKGFVALRKLNSSAKFIALSGTPIKNKPSEFFTLLNLLDPKQFSKKWPYLFKFCNPKHNGYGWQFNGATNMDELNMKLQPLMIRRIKTEVLPDLPPMVSIVVPMEVDKVEIKNYNTASDEFKEWIKKNTDPNAIKNNIDRLKQLAYIAKRNSVISWIEDYLSSGNKLVVGTYHVMAIEDMMRHFKDIAVKIDGGVTGVKRQDAVDRFQKDEKIRLIVCQILTVPGLTLTAASATCAVEFAWSPADHSQFAGRTSRIGQKADSVFAYYLVAPGTVDERCAAIINKKHDVLNRLIDNKYDQDIFDGSMMKEIMKEYGKEIG